MLCNIKFENSNHFFMLLHIYKRRIIVEVSFLELRCKEVVNIVDGRRLGHIVDLIFDITNGRILGLVVPGNKNFWNVFKAENGIFIPFEQVCKVGEDAILVELYTEPSGKSKILQMKPSKKDNE